MRVPGQAGTCVQGYRDLIKLSNTLSDLTVINFVLSCERASDSTCWYNIVAVHRDVQWHANYGITLHYKDLSKIHPFLWHQGTRRTRRAHGEKRHASHTTYVFSFASTCINHWVTRMDEGSPSLLGNEWVDISNN